MLVNFLKLQPYIYLFHYKTRNFPPKSYLLISNDTQKRNTTDSASNKSREAKKSIRRSTILYTENKAIKRNSFIFIY